MLLVSFDLDPQVNSPETSGFFDLRLDPNSSMHVYDYIMVWKHTCISDGILIIYIYIYTYLMIYIYIYTRISDPNRIKYETMKTCVDLVYPIVAKSCIVFILSTRKTQPTKHWATARPFFEVGCVAWVGCVLAGSSTTWVVALSMSAATTGPGGMFPMDSCRTQPGFFQPTRHVWDRKNMVS